MAFMNRHDGESKFQSLLDALTDCDRRRSYDLFLATCYCTPEAVRRFIDAIQAKLRIAAIYLYLDRRTAISIGHERLTALMEAYPEVLFIYAIKAGRLFHTKGYCLAAYSGDHVVHGRLAIGSANLTAPGLTDAHGNIESIAIHSDIRTIQKFLEFFDDEDTLIDLKDKDLTDFSQDDPADATDFQYALLTLGYFSHNWSAALANYFSVRHQLNEEGRRRVREGSPEEIERLGFQMDVASISRSYFDFNLQDWRRPDDGSLVKNFGIECFLGHWIPKSIVDDGKEKNKKFKKFKIAMFDDLDSKMKRICRDINEHYESLISDGIIDKREISPTRAFQDRTEALRKDKVQLYRIWSGRHFFDFPYDLENVEAIRDTFDDLVDTARRSKKRNRIKRAVLEAVIRRTLKPLSSRQMNG